MKKKLAMLMGTAIIGVGSIVTPMVTNAAIVQQQQVDLGVAGQGDVNTDNDSFVKVVQNFVKWILGFLGLITVIILIWGGFQMVTAAGDDNKYKKGFTIVKQAAIGLLLIFLSWLIVSLIFSAIIKNT